MTLPKKEAVTLPVRKIRLVEPVQREHQASDQAGFPGIALLEESLELDLVVWNQAEQFVTGGMLEEEPALRDAKALCLIEWKRQRGGGSREQPFRGIDLPAPQPLIPGRMRQRCRVEDLTDGLEENANAAFEGKIRIGEAGCILSALEPLRGGPLAHRTAERR